MALTGMDIEQVRALARQMDQHAETIRQLSQELTSRLDNTPWTGPDQVQFLGEWRGTHSTQLNNVVNGLKEASQKAMANAQDQEAASSR